MLENKGMTQALDEQVYTLKVVYIQSANVEAEGRVQDWETRV
jgi:hypothetical protein